MLLVTLFLMIIAAYSTKVFDHSNGVLQFLHIGLVVVTFLAGARGQAAVLLSPLCCA